MGQLAFFRSLEGRTEDSDVASLVDWVSVMLITMTELVSPQQVWGESDHFCLEHIQFEVLKVEMTWRQ